MLRFDQELDFPMPVLPQKTTWDIIRDKPELARLAMSCMRFDIDSGTIQKKPGLPKIYEPKPKIVLPVPMDPLVFTFPNGKKLAVSKSFIVHHSATIKDIINAGMLEETINLTSVQRKSLKLLLHILYNPGALDNLSVHLFRVGVLDNLLIAADMLNIQNLKALLNMAMPKYISFYFQVVKFYTSFFCVKQSMYFPGEPIAQSNDEEISSITELLNTEPSGYAMIQVHHLIAILDQFSCMPIIAEVFKQGLQDIIKVITGNPTPDLSAIINNLKPETYIALVKAQQDHINEINETAGMGGLIKSMKNQIDRIY